MIIDDKGRVFGRLSIIDILAIVAIILALYGGYTRYFSSLGRILTTPSVIEYDVTVRGVRQGTVDGLDRKGKLYDRKTGEEIGEIIQTSSENTLAESVKVDGTLVMAALPERYDVTVTIRCNGKVGKTGYFNVRNAELAVGSDFEINSKYVRTNGLISRLEGK